MVNELNLPISVNLCKDATINFDVKAQYLCQWLYVCGPSLEGKKRIMKKNGPNKWEKKKALNNEKKGSLEKKGKEGGKSAYTNI